MKLCPLCNNESFDPVSGFCDRCGLRQDDYSNPLRPCIGEVKMHWLACSHCINHTKCKGIETKHLKLVEEEGEKVSIFCPAYKTDQSRKIT